MEHKPEATPKGLASSFSVLQLQQLFSFKEAMQVFVQYFF
jgi:hypothetical protein